MSLSTLNQYWESYLAQLEKNPVETKALTAASMSVVSDVLAQTLTGGQLTNLNWTSIRHQFIIGLFVRGPLVHYWYKVLEGFFQRAGFTEAQQATAPVVLGKVALDQLVFSPPFNLLYFYVIGLLQGTDSAIVQQKIAKDFVPLMLANWKVWPLINVINFKFIPPKLRVLFGNVVSIFWMTYVIKMTAGKK